MKLILTLLIIGIIGLDPTSVFGAQISFQPAGLALPQNQNYTVTILLNTEGDNLNAIDGTLLISRELGRNIVVTDSGSIVTYWVEFPKFDPSSNTIKFSGTIPGGYSGNSGILFSLVLPAHFNINRIDNVINPVSVNAYKNDGLGSSAKITTKQFSLGGENSVVDPDVSQQLYIDPNKIDNIPPEIFHPQVSRDDRVFDGKWFINFATIDKQSGVDRFEIQESRSGVIDAGRWQTASSPYVLQDQELHSYIFITAIDRQGNERIIKVFPREPLSWWENGANNFVMFGGLLIVIGVVVVLHYKRKKLQIA